MRPLEAWGASRDHADLSRHADDLLQAAEAYIAAWPRHPPDAFLDTRGKRRIAVDRAFDNGHGWAARLLMTLEEPYFYTLGYRALGLEPEDADPRNYRDPATVERWKAAIRRTFRGHPRYFRIECAGKIHAHVIADKSACPQTLRLGSAAAKPVTDLEGLVAYLSKPSATYTAENLAAYWRAKRDRRRLPRVSGTGDLPNEVNVPPCFKSFSTNQASTETPVDSPSVVAPNRHRAPAYRPPSNYRCPVTSSLKREHSASEKARAPPDAPHHLISRQKRRPKHMARPSKMTASTVETLKKSLEVGQPVTVACRLGGISTSTYYGWIERGRREFDRLSNSTSTRPKTRERPFLDTFRVLQRAQLEAELDMLRIVNAAAQGGYITSRTVHECRISTDPSSPVVVVEEVVSYALPNGRAAIWFLERRFAERWGRGRKATKPRPADIGLTLDEWNRISQTVAHQGRNL